MFDLNEVKAVFIDDSYGFTEELLNYINKGNESF